MKMLSRRNVLKTGLAAVAAQAGRSLFAAGGPMIPTPTQALLSDFAVNSFHALCSSNPLQNVFFSPLSIVEALGMLQAGARGITAEQLAKAIGVPQQQMPDLIERINQILLGKDRPYKLSLANAVWVEQTYPLREDYQKLIETKYSGQGSNCDFKSQPDVQRQRINDWVSQKTEGKIKDLLPPNSIDAMTRLVLTNAIYFNAAWASRFEKSLTMEGDFKLDVPEKSVKAQLMNTQFSRLGYYEDEHLQATDLPYQGNTASMLVVLPKDRVVAEMEKLLSVARINGIIADLRQDRVAVTLPKFKLETGYDLIPPLRAMGIESAFSGQADFSGISEVAQSQGLKISTAVHKAFIDVNEERTEAAGATGMVGVALSAAPRPLQTFRADHPFVILIRDRQSGEILFLGRVADPSA